MDFRFVDQAIKMCSFCFVDSCWSSKKGKLIISLNHDGGILKFKETVVKFIFVSLYLSVYTIDVPNGEIFGRRTS